MGTVLNIARRTGSSEETVSLLFTIILTVLVTTPLTNASAFTNGQAASTVIGQPDFTTVTPGSGNNKLTLPHSITLDSAGNLLVVDSDNHRVLQFNARQYSLVWQSVW